MSNTLMRSAIQSIFPTPTGISGQFDRCVRESVGEMVQSIFPTPTGISGVFDRCDRFCIGEILQ
ncbi:MAG: hypothetical protein F6J90_01885 [Moorea sp. SIOASIH]|uniref:hypothetical protein n=1 Tax=Moorena sp. SIOASIH TaxID=2607817 RepID=UPI0013B60F01|nr:hypothetical protein [Moorena sp. SIOASIH]NEO35119.1 hypothetical protein [Moorena sp. SIOASIH]